MTTHMMERKVVCHEAQIAASADAIFPLLCPVREYEWIDGWSCRMIHSTSGVAEKGAIFTTAFRPEGDSTWIVSGYALNRAIEFVVLFPGSHVTVLEISLAPASPGRTTVRWVCTFTSLVGGNAFLANVSQEWFDREQTYFAHALAHYCLTGKMLSR